MGIPDGNNVGSAPPLMYNGQNTAIMSHIVSKYLERNLVSHDDFKYKIFMNELRKDNANTELIIKHFRTLTKSIHENKNLNSHHINKHMKGILGSVKNVIIEHKIKREEKMKEMYHKKLQDILSIPFLS